MITSESSGSIDSIRTLRMAAYGMLILGPTQHLWFNSMSKVLPQRDTLTTLKKLFMGQAIFGPFITSIFFSYNAALQGESGAEIVARLKRDLLPTLVNGLLYWPICDFVTYKFIPVQLQVWRIPFSRVPTNSTSEQFMFICLDNLSDIHGKLKESEHRLVVG
ncbi:hypothetical protein JRO89_XS07G0084400 [Xanthoceras sorbifolium]|uniref:PXMP2/4 family protein 4 n=1 Tax=Xanthoceras sorbifolium TaxID=99658 RepID=A0ABQ8HT44_9ROSI|nr:hypothetical protein JRO89_XS07G0084400 [Xanthoceras sorbifolium]